MKFFLFIYLFIKFEESINAENIGTFWQLTDVHLYGDYNSKSNHYGVHEYDSPFALMLSAFDAAKYFNSNPDFILWTGDNAPHESISKEATLTTIKNVTQQLYQRFPKTKIFPITGNHDVAPKDLLPLPAGDWCSKLASVWQPFLTAFPNATESFTKGCYYSAQVTNKCQVIVLNTLLWYSFNSQIDPDQNEDPADQFYWLNNQLNNARNNQIKVIVTAHIPPGASEVTPSKYRHLKPFYAKKFLQLLTNYADVIMTGIFAHEHSDTFRLLKDSKTNEVKNVFFLSPSITPLHSKGVGKSYPAIRQYYFTKDDDNDDDDNVTSPLTSSSSSSSSTSSPRLLDYEQFHFNLSGANAAYVKSNGTFNDTNYWQFEYRAGEIYFNTTENQKYFIYKNNSKLLTNDFSAQFWSKIADQLLTNASVYKIYIQHHLAGGPHDYDWQTKQYQIINYCSITQLDASENGLLDQCLASPNHKGDFKINLAANDMINNNGGNANGGNANGNGDNYASYVSLSLTLSVILGFCATLIAISLIVNKAFCRKRNTTYLSEESPQIANYNYLRM